MKAIILAAGYATRLYPLTKDKPKPLLPIGNITIMDFIVGKIEPISEIDTIYIVTNHTFINHFVEWSQKVSSKKKIVIIDDMTTTNDNRLGAIADLHLVIKKEQIVDDILVMAGDNLFDFELVDMINFYKLKRENVISTYFVEDEEQLKRTGVICLDETDLVLNFEEKPQNPKSRYAVPPFYIYTKDTVKQHIDEYVNSGENSNKLDAPGNLIPFLLKKSKVYAYKFKGRRYDIGTLESYNQVKKVFENAY